MVYKTTSCYIPVLTILYMCVDYSVHVCVVANVTLVVTPLSVSEDSGVVTACVSIYPVAQMNVVVVLSTADGTATGKGAMVEGRRALDRTEWSRVQYPCENRSTVVLRACGVCKL